MKVKITRPDGMIIELEGEADEIYKCVPPPPIQFVPYNPLPAQWVPNPFPTELSPWDYPSRPPFITWGGVGGLQDATSAPSFQTSGYIQEV